MLSEAVANDYTILCIVPVQKKQRNCQILVNKILFYRIEVFNRRDVDYYRYYFLLSFLSKFLILFTFNRIKKSIENKSRNAIKEKYNEITNIFTTERDKISKKIEKLEEDNESLIKIIEHYHAIQLKPIL
jgi:hypothetical protein